ncbi:unnamed protein product [Periconia digitata]|uniref:F-box domain-containing protein n=1 Tax=Periconia digitata TaxID=1303443 RepID=A0A9W4U5D6_9PLEO|nr:unnamed protein product [Periconia digitata]
MAAPTATSRAFAITEILENILLQLPLRDLLLAQALSKSVQNLITTSPALQAALCFRSTSPEATGAAYTVNPLIASAFPNVFAPLWDIDTDEAAKWQQKLDAHGPSSTEDSPSMIEASLPAKTPPEETPSPEKTESEVDIYGIDDETYPVGAHENPPTVPSHQRFWYSAWLLNPAAWRREHASWRRMRVTKEPLRRLVLLEKHYGMGGSTVVECILRLGDPRASESTACLEGRERIDVGTELQTRSDRYDEPGTVVPKHGWMTVDGQAVDLESLDGLPMSLFHDYLSQLVCSNGEPPAFQIYFYPSYPPTPDPVLKDHLPPSVMDEFSGFADRDDVGDGLTMLIETNFSHGCVIQSNPIFPGLCSGAAGKVEVGPWVTKSMSRFG